MFETRSQPENFFLQDLRACRDGSRAMLRSATGRRSDPALSIDLLQSVLAAELICVLRYTLLSVSEDGLKNDRLATEFQAQANDERRHMAMLSSRIEALGGVPDFSPAGLGSRIAALACATDSFAERLRQNLAAEQCVVEHYRELVRFFDRHDPDTAEILQDILQDEEDHTSDMQDLLISSAG
jgi:bacterioferritin